MKNLKVKKLLLAMLMASCMAHQALAEAVPKAESVITHDRITLGDVFDGVTENTDYYLAPAPATGKTVTLDVHDLTRISDAFNLGWTAGDPLQHVVIRRSSTEIDSFDIQAALQQQMTGDMKGQKFEMEMTDRSVGFHVPETADRTVNIEGLTYDAAKGTFKAVVSAAAVPGVKKEVKGRFYQISRIPVLKDPMGFGDVISARDIDYIDMRAPEITASTVTDASRLIGQSPRRSIAALKPITASDVQMPVVVKKGDVVTMVFKTNAISLTTQGRALDSGAEGDAIRVMNTSSKHIVDAVVTGAQTVSIKPVSTL